MRISDWSSDVCSSDLFADQADRHHAAGRRGDGRAEKALQHEDAFGMMAQGAVTEIGGDRLGLVEPLVERQIILGRAAPLLHARQRMMIAMSHRRLLKTRGCDFRRSRPARYSRA